MGDLLELDRTKRIYVYHKEASKEGNMIVAEAVQLLQVTVETFPTAVRVDGPNHDDWSSLGKGFQGSSVPNGGACSPCGSVSTASGEWWVARVIT